MNRSRHRGFTLIELIIFIVVVSVGLVGILKVMDVTVKSSADPMVRKQAMALADSILEEILLKSYCDPDTVNAGTNPPTCGVNTVESGRDAYDDVDDYNGLTQAAFTDLPAELTGPSGYVIAISVAAPASLSGVPMKKVTVTVSRGSESITMTGYRANF
ncbi:type II secretion system protein [Rhodoferax sp. UBA5149]|uniref:type II secretion system protein n=1 Tax=Rhodoferax sp. UBA5149 TaxID=1947379 RepID=UPI0025E2953F|nr:type II secretion system protein [Rhodoferax sp. UBA5149]